MGRVRTKTVKRASRELIEKYYFKLSEDFHLNKKVLDGVAEVATKRLRNRIAGYTTHLMKRIQKGPVKGVSLRIQEEQRERLLDVIPEKSRVATDRRELELDDAVLLMLEKRGFDKLLAAKHVVARKPGATRS